MLELVTAFIMIATHRECTLDEYEYKRDLVWCHDRIGIGIVVDGFLNENGDWQPDINDLIRSINDYRADISRHFRKLPYVMKSMYPNEKVYEYRSGILIPMIFHERLGLMPEVGGKMVEFKDYEYSPAARRIYNLPGFFRPK